MQANIDSQHPDLEIQIIGVNERGHEVGNSLMPPIGSLPWLQDVDDNTNNVSDVWYEQWNVGFRDVFILDQANTHIGTINLTDYDLANPDYYSPLEDTLVDLAAGRAPWQNDTDAMDVNGDSVVTAQGDVLPCINEINLRNVSQPDGKLPLPPLTPNGPAPMYDFSGDHHITAQADVLPIINFINANSGSNAEGEGHRHGPRSAVSDRDLAEDQDSRPTVLIDTALPQNRALVSEVQTADAPNGDWYETSGDDLVTIEQPADHLNVQTIIQVGVGNEVDEELGLPLESILDDVASEVTNAWNASL